MRLYTKAVYMLVFYFFLLELGVEEVDLHFFCCKMSELNYVFKVSCGACGISTASIFVSFFCTCIRRVGTKRS